MKTDAAGDAQWNKTYAGEGVDHVTAIVGTSDGGYALAGYTAHLNSTNYDFWLIKTDSSGNMLWSKTYGGPYSDEANALVQTSDGGFALGGSIYDSVSAFCWLAKTDSLGNLQWNATYGTISFQSYVNSIIQTGDGGYVLTGNNVELLSSGYNGNLSIIKTNPSGTAQ